MTRVLQARGKVCKREAYQIKTSLLTGFFYVPPSVNFYVPPSANSVFTQVHETSARFWEVIKRLGKNRFRFLENRITTPIVEKLALKFTCN